jgi:hypothetical protein
VFDDTWSVQFARSFTGCMTTKETISTRVKSAALLSARPKPPSRTADWNTLYRVYIQGADLPGKLLVNYDTPTLVRFDSKWVYHIRRPAGWTQVQDSAWNTGTHTLEGVALLEKYSASGAARWHPERLWKPTPYSTCQTGTSTRQQQLLYIRCWWLWFRVGRWEEHQDVLRWTIREKSPGTPRTSNHTRRVLRH